MLATKKRLGLALGPGALRGLAHIGVLQVLEENGIVPDVVTGNSIGAIVGALYCSGITPTKLEHLVLEMDERSFYDIGVSRTGFMRGNKLLNLLRTLTDEKTFDQTTVPFGTYGTDIENGVSVELTKGLLCEAARASSSIPGVFSPMVIDNKHLADGGLLIGVPGHLARKLGADVVIGVNVSSHGVAGNHNTLIDISVRSLLLMQWELYQHLDPGVDCMLRPDVNDLPPLRMSHAADCIERGRVVAREALPAILALLEQGDTPSSCLSSPA
nr:patatin-like phospholipase family protein [bacterium]